MPDEEIDLDETEIRILEMIVKPQYTGYAEALADDLAIRLSLVELHLIRLAGAGYIFKKHSTGASPPFYELASKGLEHLHNMSLR